MGLMLTGADNLIRACFTNPYRISITSCSSTDSCRSRHKQSQYWCCLVRLSGRDSYVADRLRTTEQATKYGFSEEPHLWANLGQGAPEVDDDIEGCFPRPTTIPLSMEGREYGPTAGIKPLRAAVANLYNENYRKGKESK